MKGLRHIRDRFEIRCYQTKEYFRTSLKLHVIPCVQQEQLECTVLHFSAVDF
jgi:hypothetical protein